MRRRPSAKKPAYDALKPNDRSGEREGKVVILHGFSPAQLHEFVAVYREQTHLPQDVAFAVVTEKSAMRRLGEVVEELQREAREVAQRTAATPGDVSSPDS
jgi:hypothetical protein